MKKSLVLAMAMALGVTASAYAANPFSDVPAGHWAYDSVAKLAAAGVVDGYADGAFAGDKLITRYKKQKARDYFNQLEQKIQRNASAIDNYLEQRVMVLQNCARLLDKAIDLDKDTFTKVAMYRSGNTANEDERNSVASQLDGISKSVNIAFEKYPDLQAHKEIQDAMQQNMYLQREITAARELYNDSIDKWNRDVFAWPTKRIVAAKEGYTTRIPFIASQEIKQKAREVFF